MKQCERCEKETENYETKIYEPHDYAGTLLCDDCVIGLNRYLNGVELKE